MRQAYAPLARSCGLLGLRPTVSGSPAQARQTTKSINDSMSHCQPPTRCFVWFLNRNTATTAEAQGLLVQSQPQHSKFMLRFESTGNLGGMGFVAVLRFKGG